MSTAMRSEKQLTHALLCNNCKKKTRSKTTTGLANDSFSCHAALMRHRFLFGYLFLSCWQAFLQVEHCAVVHSHAVCIKCPLCPKWAPRGRPTRWPSHTFLNFKSCTFIPPCSDPQRLIWFGLWILNWPPNWALHKMDQFKASLNTAASGSLTPPPDVCKAPLPPSLPLLSISIRVFKCIKWADAPFKYDWLHHVCTCSLPWIQVNFLPLLSLHLAIPH